MITKQQILDGIKTNTIRFISEDGTVCLIGDIWFYFDEEAEEMEPELYFKATPVSVIVDKIFDTLQDMKRVGDVFTEEYSYYEHILLESEAKNHEQQK